MAVQKPFSRHTDLWLFWIPFSCVPGPDATCMQCGEPEAGKLEPNMAIKQSGCPYDELQPRLCLCSLGIQCQGRQNLGPLGVADSPLNQQERHYSHLLLGGKTMVCMLPKGAFAHGGDLVVVKAPPCARRLILHMRHCTHTFSSAHCSQLHSRHSTMLLACLSPLSFRCQSFRQPQTWTSQTQLNVYIPASPHIL